jgi:hypothetical protein
MDRRGFLKLAAAAGAALAVDPLAAPPGPPVAPGGGGWVMAALTAGERVIPMRLVGGPAGMLVGQLVADRALTVEGVRLSHPAHGEADLRFQLVRLAGGFCGQPLDTLNVSVPRPLV